MFVHGVSGEAEVTHTMIRDSLIDQGPVLSMYQNREVGIQAVCHQVL